MAGLQGISGLQGSFPPDAVAGYTGEYSQWAQGTSLPPQDLNIQAKNRNILPGFEQEPYADPYGIENPFAEFTLPGEMNPDQTPRTHTTPFAGWAGNTSGDGEDLLALNQNIMEVHSEDFGALKPRIHSAKWATGQEPADIWYDEGSGESQLQPLSGQARSSGGYDSVQGYGGGGTGPGGINPESPGHGKRTLFTEAQPTYSLAPAERPFIVPQGGYNAIFTDEIQGPQNSPYAWSYGDGASPYHNATAYEPPAEPATFDSSQYIEGPIV